MLLQLQRQICKSWNIYQQPECMIVIRNSHAQIIVTKLTNNKRSISFVDQSKYAVAFWEVLKQWETF